MKTIKCPRIILLLCLVTFPLLLISCTSQKPIPIGFTASLTGKHSEMSINLRNGVRQALPTA